MSVNFKLLANPTTLDIIIDKGPKPGPPVMLSNGIESFQFPGVAHSFVIMEHSCYVTTKVDVFWNVIFVLVEQNILAI
jgi:hypothetical protein